MVSITLPRRNGADIVTALEMVRKPTAAGVNRGKDRKTQSSESQQNIHFKQMIAKSK